MNGNYDHARDLLEFEPKELGYPGDTPTAELVARAQVHALLALVDAVAELTRRTTQGAS